MATVPRELGVLVRAVVDRASFGRAGAEISAFSQKVGTEGVTIRPNLTEVRKNARLEAETRLRAYEAALQAGITDPLAAKTLLKDLTALQREALKIGTPQLTQDIQRAMVAAQDLVSTLKQIPRTTARDQVIEFSPEQKAAFESTVRDLIGRSSEAFRTMVRSADLTPVLQQLRSYQTIAYRMGLPELVRDLRVVLGIGGQVARTLKEAENATINTVRAARMKEAAMLAAQRAGKMQLVAEREMQAEFAKREANARRMWALETRAAKEMAAEFERRKAEAKKFWTINLAGTELSIARLAVWGLGWTVVYRAINQVTAAIGALTIGGVARFAAFQQQVFRLAAELINIDPGRPFRHAVAEAEQVLTAMTKLRAAFIGTDTQLQELVVTATRFGIIRDLTDENLAKLVVFGNLILSIGAQGARTNQIFGETQSIMERAAQAGDQVLRAIKALDPEWKKNLDNAAATGKTLDYILSLFPGYQEQVKFVNELLVAQAARLQAVLDRILRIAAAPIAREILAGLTTIVNALERYEKQAAATAAFIGKAIMGGIAAAIVLGIPKLFKFLGGIAATNFIFGFKGIGMGALFFGLVALSQQSGIEGGAAYATAFIATIGAHALGVAIGAALSKLKIAAVGAALGKALIAAIGTAIASPVAIAGAIAAAVGLITAKIISAWKKTGDAADDALNRQRLAIAANVAKLKTAAEAYARSVEGLQAKFRRGEIAPRTFIEGLIAEQQRIVGRMEYIQRSLAQPGLSPATVSALVEEFKKLQPELDSVLQLIKDTRDEQHQLLTARFDEYIAKIRGVRNALADLDFRRLRAEGNDLAASLAEMAHRAVLAIEEYEKAGVASFEVLAAAHDVLIKEQRAAIFTATQEIWERYKSAYDKALGAARELRDAQIEYTSAVADAITEPLKLRVEGLEQFALPELANAEQIRQHFQTLLDLQNRINAARLEGINISIAEEQQWRAFDPVGSRQREIALLNERAAVIGENVRRVVQLIQEEARLAREGIMKNASAELAFLQARKRLLEIRLEFGLLPPGTNLERDIQNINTAIARLEGFQEIMQSPMGVEQLAALQTGLVGVIAQLSRIDTPEARAATARLEGMWDAIGKRLEIAKIEAEKTSKAMAAFKEAEAAVESTLKKVEALRKELVGLAAGVYKQIADEFTKLGTWVSGTWLPWLVQAFASAGDKAGQAFAAAFSKAMGTIPTVPRTPGIEIPSRQMGGYIEKTGPYLLHKGEYVIAESRAARAPVTNISISIGGMDVTQKLSGPTVKELLSAVYGAAGKRHQRFLRATGMEVPA